MSLDLTLGAQYTLTTYAPSVLGVGLTSAKLKAILDYDTVSRLQDVASIHATVLSELPPGTQSSPAQLVYYKFQTTTGKVVYLAEEWISNCEVATIQDLTVVLNNVATGDISRLRELLTANGFIYVIQEN